MIATLIPAAGQSARMGGSDKLLEQIDGQAILTRTARRAIAAGLGPVLVALPPDKTARQRALRNLTLTRLTVPDALEGMAATLRAGASMAAELDGLTGLMILLPDMPEIETDDLKTLAQAFAKDETTPLRATTEDGQLGHPTLFPRNMLPLFATLKGDKGAASLFQSHPPRLVPLQGTRARLDLDTPEDWTAWRDDTNF